MRHDDTIVLWDTTTGERLHTIEGYTDSVLSMAWSPDGKTLAAGYYGSIILWDTTTGKWQLTREVHNNNVWSIAWSPDGAMLATGIGDRGTLILWDVKTGDRLRTFQGHTLTR